MFGGLAFAEPKYVSQMVVCQPAVKDLNQLITPESGRVKYVFEGDNRIVITRKKGLCESSVSAPTQAILSTYYHPICVTLTSTCNPDDLDKEQFQTILNEVEALDRSVREQKEQAEQARVEERARKEQARIQKKAEKRGGFSRIFE
jgi:hypothetical protein